MPEPVKLGDVVYFGMTVHTPPSGALVNTDVTPRWMMFRNGSDTITLQGDFTQRSGHIGRYRSSGILSAGNGFSTNDYIEVHASGRVGGQYDGCIVKSFIIDDIFDSNIVKVSGNDVTIGDFSPNIYYANIKYVRDNLTDRYGVSWYKNGQLMNSGNLTNPALSVYNSQTGASLILDKVMSYASPTLGIVRYNETGSLATSGIPYEVITSGNIDGSVKQWKNIIGLDIL